MCSLYVIFYSIFNADIITKIRLFAYGNSLQEQDVIKAGDFEQCILILEKINQMDTHESIKISVIRRMLRLACQYNYPSIIDLIVNDDIKIYDTTTTTMAYNGGYKNLAESLNKRYASMPKLFNMQIKIINAYKNGHISVAESLLKKINGDISWRNIVSNVCKVGNIKTIKYIIKKADNKINWSGRYIFGYIIESVCKSNKIEAIIFLIDKLVYNHHEYRDVIIKEGLIQTVANGHTKIILYIFNMPDINWLIYDFNRLFRAAAASGCIKTILTVLEICTKKVNIGWEPNVQSGLQHAYRCGHQDAIELLTYLCMKKHRNIGRYSPFRWACTYGNFDFMQSILDNILIRRGKIPTKQSREQKAVIIISHMSPLFRKRIISAAIYRMDIRMLEFLIQLRHPKTNEMLFNIELTRWL